MSVELGFVDKRKAWKLRSKYFPSKVGGCPSWLKLNNLPNRSDLLCQNCNKPLTFLLQVYAPVFDIDDGFHRTIFMFMCRNVDCNQTSGCGNFAVFRNQMPRQNEFYSSEPPEMIEKTSLQPSAEQYQPICVLCGCQASLKCEKCSSKDYCCEDHRDRDWEWNHSNNCTALNKDTGTKQRKLINNCLLPEFELVTETEELSEEGPERSEEDRMKDFEKYVRATSAKEFKDMPLGDMDEGRKDKAFYRFLKRIKQEPEQVLRYQRSGEPLWVSSENVPSDKDIPNCSCGAKRIFEFQVVPQLLHYLSLDYELEWGTLIVYTCSKSCKIGTESYAREFLWKQDISNSKFQ